MNKNILPEFLIVGAAKSGTTAIAKYLSDHEQIFIPERKECRFFSGMEGVFKGPGDYKVNDSVIKENKDYLKLFKKAKNNQIKGDASPDYLFYYDRTIKNIKENYDDVGQEYPKIIIILRNPIERAFSQYMHFVRDLREEEVFLEALKKEKKRKNEKWEWAWYYKEVGFYYNQVKNYLGSFVNIKIFIYDDFRNDNQKVLNEIISFLDLETFQFDFAKRHNESGNPKNFILQKLYVRLFIPPSIRKWVPVRVVNSLKHVKQYFVKRNLEKVKITAEEKDYLKNVYKEEINQLGELLNKDLSHWLN